MLTTHLHPAVMYRRAAALVGLIATLAAIASSNVLHDALLQALAVTDGIIHRHALLGAVAFVVLAAVSAMFAFVSIALVAPVAVFTWGSGATIGLLWLGWVLGGIVMYGLGVSVGRPVARWLTKEDALRRWESRLSADAPLSLIVLVQLALPSEITGYLLGLLRYPFGRFVAALALAEVPYAIATVHLGASFVEGRSGLIAGTGILLVMLSLVALYGLSRALGHERSDVLRDCEET
jgi:uncharacterized membrane protein YdjX (TVP38/TMEM64 family)